MTPERRRRLAAHSFVVMSVLIVLICVIIYFQFWRLISNEESLQDDINFQVDGIWAAAQAPIPTPPADHQERLENAQSRLASARQLEFPTQMSNTEIMEMLLTRAEEKGITLSMQSRPASGADSTGYDTLSYSVTASGNLGALLEFVGELEEESLETLELQNASFSGAGESWTANFSMTVHTQLPEPLPEIDAGVGEVPDDVSDGEEEAPQEASDQPEEANEEWEEEEQFEEDWAEDESADLDDDYEEEWVDEWAEEMAEDPEEEWTDDWVDDSEDIIEE